MVVGASFAGLCAAWQLVKRGVRDVAILEQHRVGHVKGASHGRARLSSCVGYEEPTLSLLRHAQTDAWPALQAELGRTLTRAVPGLAFGELGVGFRRRAQAAYGLGDAVKPVEAAEVARAFPQLAKREELGVLRDGTATLIAAEAAYDALLAWLQAAGVRVVPNTRVQSIHSTADALWLETDRGRRVAERVILTAGGWTGALVGRLEERLVWRREVAVFFALDAPEESWRVGRFPPFRALDEETGIAWSGLPEFADRGVKVVCHIPEEAAPTLREAVDRMTAWFSRTFTVKPAKVLGTEVRNVGRVTDRPFLLDTHFDDPRIVFAAGLNGDEVAFGPLVGRLLAELSIEGRSTLSAFQGHRKEYAIPRRGLAEARQKRPPRI